MRLRDRFFIWMQGRYGADQLSRFESGLLIVILIVNMFLRRTVVYPILYFVSLGLLIHVYFRMFSKNIEKRRRENQWYCTASYKIRVKWNKMVSHHRQRKVYRFYKCPMCRQKVRVPKGRGRISITCPKCRQEFVRKS